MARGRRELSTEQSEDVTVALEIPPTGEARIEGGIDPVTDMLTWKDKAEKLAFDTDILVITIMPGDKNSENPVPVGVNGRQVLIWRGKKTALKRMYVERLALAKEGNVRQPDIEDTDPRKVNRLEITQAMRYPLTIHHDPSPRGEEWWNHLMGN